MSDVDSLVLYRREGRIAHIVLNRDEVLNAFDDDLVVALRARLIQFDQDDEAWISVISGAGRAFSSGADVRKRQLRDLDVQRAQGGPAAPGASHHSLLFEDQVNWKPVIAAVHGYVLGMAVGIALGCEFVVAEPDTIFEVSETPRGLYPGPYWSVLRFRGVGSFADEVVLTGRRFGAAEAFGAGVLNRVSASGQHVREAVDLAEKVLANPPLSVRSAVRARRWKLEEELRIHGPIREGWKHHLSEDFRESAQAFAERRAPRPYTGR